MDPKINSVIPFPAQNTLKKVAGIYTIVNLINNKQYIGSTVYCWISKNNNPDGWRFTKVYIKNNGRQD